ncbi:MAG: DUF3368 domain-containing protein [Candidatus Aenigmarchaeota archaeon]|nr:DUF3368 domain-containing protein [Candidatus Aenigmarchaeota archaeon]MDI6722006.1 DUF3368 domain-containing protein [Candidatus Aenigmarchaeota archaeon]
MRLVLDSTPLIYFAKIGLIEKLGRLKAEKIIPSHVFHEVVEKGKEANKPDSFIIEKFVRVGRCRIEKSDIPEAFLQYSRMTTADAETLELARKFSGIAIIDDSYLRTVAEYESIDYRGSIFLLFRLYEEKLIKRGEIKYYLDTMISHGWRCSTELYVLMLNEINKLA